MENFIACIQENVKCSCSKDPIYFCHDNLSLLCEECRSSCYSCLPVEPLSFLSDLPGLQSKVSGLLNGLKEEMEMGYCENEEGFMTSQKDFERREFWLDDCYYEFKMIIERKDIALSEVEKKDAALENSKLSISNYFGNFMNGFKEEKNIIL
ncbi:unnamed protein product [Moneuplotes crassus]|uniref:Uncharacterized protein n=1 Tax=Euplotes crassus TaxID=5936 RepID=A0AAD1U8I0_EUPCR|nr:unnamed protein product [Moneuplotes crassus]